MTSIFEGQLPKQGRNSNQIQGQLGSTIQQLPGKKKPIG